MSMTAFYLSGEYFSKCAGFTDIDDNGLSGIELANENILQSNKGLKKIRKDNLGRSVEMLEIIREPKPGRISTFLLIKDYNTLHIPY